MAGKHSLPVEHLFRKERGYADQCWICMRPKRDHPTKESKKHHGPTRHRGKYKPNWHWSHAKCYPNGVCYIGVEVIKLRVYHDSYAEAPGNELLPDMVSITFSGESDTLAL